MSKERRQTQYLADVTQLNVERQKRNATALDPNSQETRDHWHATQETNHERLFAFSDNLTTLMFIVASDLSEAQRERRTSSLSLQKMNVTAYTFDAVNTVFVKLFCTPKSSMENPSLRVSGHGNSMNRTFIVEECAEDEFGQWAIDGVTGEQGYIDDDEIMFLDMRRQRACLAVQTIQRSPGEEKKGQRRRQRQRQRKR